MDFYVVTRMEGRNARQESYVATTEFLCRDNHNIVLRWNFIVTQKFIIVTKVEKNYRKNVTT